MLRSIVACATGVIIGLFFIPLSFVIPTAAAAAGPLGDGAASLPEIYLETRYVEGSGRVHRVTAADDLQASLDAAAPGDTIELEAGATFTGNFVLPGKTGGKQNRWITIRSSATGERFAPEESRVTPDHSPLMAKLVTPNTHPVMATSPAAHHYRFIGIEFTVADGVMLNYGLVTLGEGNETDVAQLPHNIIIDRCYIHGSPAADVKRGITLNSARTAIIDSYISDCHVVGQETQAILGWNGPGPFKIVNNYLEGAGENVMFGGADASIAGLVPSDIEFRRNHCFKPLSWNPGHGSYAGRHWAVKNSFELKNARRVLIDGNTFENNWVDGQVGFAVQLTPRNQDGGSPWSTVEDIVFTNNVVAHAAGGINILGRDYNHPSGQSARIEIRNNLFVDIGGEEMGFNGRFLQITETQDVVVDHNTVLQTGNIVTAYGVPSTNFRFTNNLVAHNEYGIVGDNASTGIVTFQRYFPGARFKKNVLVGGVSAKYAGKSNYYPASFDEVIFVDRPNGDYRLSPSSPYKQLGTDAKDVGVDIDALEAALGHAVTRR